MFLFVVSFPVPLIAEPSDYVLNQFVSALQLEDTVTRIHDDAVRDQLRGRPERKAIEKEIRAFLQERLSFAKLEPQFKKVVAERFTEKEMWEVIRFLNSQSGKKFVRVVPTLVSDLYLTGFDQYRTLQPDLEQVVARAALERPDAYRFQLRLNGKPKTPETKYLQKMREKRQKFRAQQTSLK